MQENEMQEETRLEGVVLANAVQELARRCHKTAADHGFWSQFNAVVAQIEATVHPSDKEGLADMLSYLEQSMIGHKQALEATEAAELMEAARHDTLKSPDQHVGGFNQEEVECADKIIRILDYAGFRNLRIGEAMLAKMTYNDSRPFRHGKKS